MDKKLVKYIFILLGLIGAMILLIFIMNLFKGPKKLSYSNLEEKVIAATKKYTKANPGVLPTIEGTSISLPVNALVEKGYLNNLSTYIKDDVTCNGTVEIYKSTFGEFDYSPSIFCGTKYETQKLSNKIIYDNDGDGVLNGMGLYKKVNGKFITKNGPQPSGSDKVEYYFRGDIINNYVKIGDNVWRIVGIDEDYNTILIYQKAFRKAYQWDDRYNEEANKNYGINIYETEGIKSRINETLQTFFDKDADLQDKEKLSPIIKNIIVPMDICIGGRDFEDTDINGKSECKTMLNDQNISLLPAYLFINASLDENCSTIKDKSCGNYNFLAAFNDYWWLLTPSTQTSSESYLVNRKYVDTSLCQAKNNVRPVIKISSRVLYQEGDGSIDNPYTIKHYN